LAAVDGAARRETFHHATAVASRQVARGSRAAVHVAAAHAIVQRAASPLAEAMGAAPSGGARSGAIRACLAVRVAATGLALHVARRVPAAELASAHAVESARRLPTRARARTFRTGELAVGIVLALEVAGVQRPLGAAFESAGVAHAQAIAGRTGRTGHAPFAAGLETSGAGARVAPASRAASLAGLAARAAGGRTATHASLRRRAADTPTCSRTVAVPSGGAITSAAA